MTNFPGSILDIEYYLPEKIVSNNDFSNQYPDWKVEQSVERVGVVERRYAEANETALDLAGKAVEKLFVKYPHLKELVDGVIFCTQSGDYIMPSNSFLIQKKFELRKNLIAFDFNLACSGYIYGLLMASSLLKTGACKNILLITGDTYSKYLRDDDRSTKLLFGDGASVTWVGEKNSSTPEPLISEFVDFKCSSDGSGWDKFIIPAGGARTPVTDDIAKTKIYMNGLQVLNFVNSKVTNQIKEILSQNQMSTDSVDMYFFHQASKLALDSLVNYLKMKPTQTFSNIAKIGNTVSSSVPILLKDYFSANTLSKDSKILMCGFGVGFSWGSLIAKR
jgi:3-oxoacyl-[acyl-carrier-protein] synthase-3